MSRKTMIAKLRKFRWEPTKGRKERRCEACYGAIDPGEIVYRTTDSPVYLKDRLCSRCGPDLEDAETEILDRLVQKPKAAEELLGLYQSVVFSADHVPDEMTRRIDELEELLDV